MYPPDDPTRPCRPKAGQGLVMMMMMMMLMTKIIDDDDVESTLLMMESTLLMIERPINGKGRRRLQLIMLMVALRSSWIISRLWFLPVLPIQNVCFNLFSSDHWLVRKLFSLRTKVLFNQIHYQTISPGSSYYFLNGHICFFSRVGISVPTPTTPKAAWSLPLGKSQNNLWVCVPQHSISAKKIFNI